MKVSLNWLKDFVDIDVTPEALCDKLVSCGFEVEEIINLSENCVNVVVGRIDRLEKHPDADKLQICSVNVGNEVVQIVTGAHNIKVGDLVPVALDNSLLPTGTRIKKGKLRGVESYGMLCSGEELKLTESDYKGAEVYGILILNEDHPLGTDVNTVFGTDDIVLDISVTANRPDCNSVIGIAREIAALLDKPLKMPDLSYRVGDRKVDEIVKVRVDAPDLCPRYMAAAVTDVKIAPSPKLIRDRLKAVGHRPINNVVDITNYVLTEIGQPMHSFDGNDLLSKEIVVRRADDGEKIVTLDGKENTLDNSMLVICDAEKPVCVAGIMGGANSGINDNTTTVVFEAAKFMRENVRKTSRKLNLRSDSSFRFERGIDLQSQEYGIKRALSLIDRLGCGTIAQGIIDVLNADTTKKTVQASCDKINGILGIEVPQADMVRILNSLSIDTVCVNGNLTCTIPLYREDIENANDLAEEIIRMYGYDNITNTLMDSGKQTLGGKTQEQKNVDTVKSILVANGMSEILTYSFTSPKVFDILNVPQESELRNTVQLLNPLGEDLSVMRTTLAHSMLNVLRSNQAKNNKDVRLFEIANIYVPKSQTMTELPCEELNCILGAYGKKEDFYTIKGVVESVLAKFGVEADYDYANIPWMHPGRSAYIKVNGKNIGYVGEVSPITAKNMEFNERVYLANINIKALNEIADFEFIYENVPKYPSVERDLAVTLKDEVLARDIIGTVRKAGGNMLKDADIFDIYRGGQIPKGSKSVAIKLSFRSPDKTLTEEEVNSKIEKILKRLEIDLQASLR